MFSSGLTQWIGRFFATHWSPAFLLRDASMRSSLNFLLTRETRALSEKSSLGGTVCSASLNEASNRVVTT